MRIAATRSKTIGIIIRERREMDGRTQKALAKEAGITPQYWNDIEWDRRLPPPETIIRIAQVFGAYPATYLWFWVRQQIGDEWTDQMQQQFLCPIPDHRRPAATPDAPAHGGEG